MNDRELLMMAAKAAGIYGEWFENFDDDDYYYHGSAEGIYCEFQDYSNKVWNPLENDGDALRLAVKLRITVSFASLSTSGDIYAQSLLLQPVFVDSRNDELAATRRAIVRAAAEIGKAMT